MGSSWESTFVNLEWDKLRSIEVQPPLLSSVIATVLLGDMQRPTCLHLLWSSLLSGTEADKHHVRSETSSRRPYVEPEAPAILPLDIRVDGWTSAALFGYTALRQLPLHLFSFSWTLKFRAQSRFR